MSLIDPGFLFVVLPVAAALYTLCPASKRSTAICLLSAALFLLIEPSHALWMLLSLCFDAIAAVSLCRRGSDSPLSKTLLLLAIVKDAALLSILCVLRPLFGAGTPPASLLVSHAGALSALLLIRKGAASASSPLLFLGNTLLLGHLPFGPITDPVRIATALQRPSPSFQKMGHGALLVVFGVTKRAILAEQLFALYKTILRLSSSQLSLGSAWLAALCPALGVFFVFSAYSDLCVGIGEIFGLSLPRMTYYPLQACSAREAVYHLNLPLGDLVEKLLSTPARSCSILASVPALALTLFVLAAYLGISLGTLLWALWIFLFCLIDLWLEKRSPRRTRSSRTILPRLLTCLSLLPAYAFLGIAPDRILPFLGALVGIGVPVTNDVLFYLVLSNGLLLFLSALLSTNAVSTFQRWLHRRSPILWWIVSTAVCIPVLIAATSFIIRL